MASRRIEWIDIAKGIAIILVVIGHVVSSYHEASLYQENEMYNFILQFVYTFHMALFSSLVVFFLLWVDAKEKRERCSCSL